MFKVGWYGLFFFVKMPVVFYIKSTKSTKIFTWKDVCLGSLGRRIHQRRPPMMPVIRIIEEN